MYRPPGTMTPVPGAKSRSAAACWKTCRTIRPITVSCSPFGGGVTMISPSMISALNPCGVSRARKASRRSSSGLRQTSASYISAVMVPPSYPSRSTSGVAPRLPGPGVPPWNARAGGRASGDGVHPAVGVRGLAALDGEQGLAELHGDGAGLAGADGPVGGGGLDVADGGDDGGGAAGEDLGDGAVRVAPLPLVGGDPALLGRVAEVGGEGEQGGAGDAGEQGAGELGGDDGGVLALAEDEVEVHAAHLLDPLVLGGGEPNHLVAALGGGLGLGDQGGRVVAGALGGAGAAGRGADVVLGEPDRDGLDAAGEVGAGRRGDDHEQVGVGGAHAQADLGGEHEGPQV